MQKNVTIKVYSFDELSDKAKEKVLDTLREWENDFFSDDWEHYLDHDELVELAKRYGFDMDDIVKTLQFDLYHGSYACLFSSGCDLALLFREQNTLIQQYPTLYEFVKAETDVRDEWFTLEDNSEYDHDYACCTGYINIKGSGGNYGGYRMSKEPFTQRDLTQIDHLDMDIVFSELEKLSDTILTWAKEVAVKIHEYLSGEYEYRQSDEYLKEEVAFRQEEDGLMFYENGRFYYPPQPEKIESIEWNGRSYKVGDKISINGRVRLITKVYQKESSITGMTNYVQLDGNVDNYNFALQSYYAGDEIVPISH